LGSCFFEPFFGRGFRTMKVASPPLALAPAAASAKVVIHSGHMGFSFR
jgi:hypothetical protein